MGGDLGEVKERGDEEYNFSLDKKLNLYCSDDVQTFFNLIDEEDIDQLKDMILSGIQGNKYLAYK